MYRHKDGINLRKVDQSDADNLYLLKQESWWGTHKTLIINRSDQKKWIDNIPSDQLFLMAAKGNDSVGVAVYTDIDWIGRSLKISGSIFEQSRCIPNLVRSAFSAGLDFAFEMLNMRRVEAEVLMTNRAAQLLEVNHLRFKIEGVKRQAVYKCGMYVDSVMLGMLREEWEQQDRVKAYGGSCNYNFDKNKAHEGVEISRKKLNPDIYYDENSNFDELLQQTAPRQERPEEHSPGQ